MSRASEYANSVSSLYAQIGEARAREAANKGAIWSGALANIGDFVAQYPERKAKMEEIKNRAAMTDLEKQRLQRQIDQEARQQAEDDQFRELFKRSQTEFDAGQGGSPQSSPDLTRGPDDSGQMQPGGLVQEGRPSLAGEIGATLASGRGPLPIQQRASPLPTPSELMRVNPERAIKIINGLAALKQDPQGDPEKSLKLLQQVANGLNALPEDMRAEAYPHLVQHFEQTGILKPGALPPTYDPTHWKFIMGTGQEPPKPKDQPLVPIPGPDGKPVYGTPVPGQPVYEKSSTAASEKNPTEWSLIADAAKGDETAKRALQIYRQQHPEGGGAAEPLVPIIGPDGKPVLVRRSQAEGKTPASSREQGRPVTSGDANRLADIAQSQAQAKELESIIGKTGAGSAIGAALPNVVTQMTGLGTDSKSRVATIYLVKQIIGKGLEGGVLRQEDEYKYAKILPTIGDAPPVAAQKIKGLQQALQDKHDALLDALDDANYDTSKYRSRTTAPVASPAAPEKPVGAVTGRVGPYTYVVK